MKKMYTAVTLIIIFFMVAALYICGRYENAPDRIFNTRKISGEIPGGGHTPMLGTAVLRGKPAKSGRLFLCCLQIDKCTTNTYAVISAQRLRNIEKGGC